MAKKITFEVEIDSSGVRTGLKKVEALAKESSRRMELTKKTFGELPTINQKTGTFSSDGSNKPGLSSIGGASTMFISAARDSFASLASGQSPLTVFLQQAPQVAQAFTMMREAGFKFLKGLLLHPVTLMIAGLVALGAALYFVIKHFTELSRVKENLRKLMDLTTTTFEDQVKIQKIAMDVTREQIEWNKKHAESQDNLATSTQAALKVLRDKAQFEQQLAGAKGASKAQLAQMEIEQAKAELALLEQSTKAAQEQYDKSRQDLTNAQNAKDEFVGFGDKSMLEKGKTQLNEAAELVKEVEKNLAASLDPILDPFGGEAYIPTSDTSKPVATANYGSMSLDEATGRYQKIQAEVLRLENAEREINDLLKDREKLTDDQKKTLADLTKDRDAAAAALGLKAQYLPKIASASGGLGGMSSDALTSVGNFLGAGTGLIGSIQQQHLDEARKQTAQLMEHGKKLDKVVTNTAPSSSSGGSIEVPG